MADAMGDFLGALRRVLAKRRPVWWILAGSVGLVLALSGISLLHTPSHEVIYDCTRMEVPPGEGGGFCVTYHIDLGNTGREKQEDVKVRFARPVIDRSGGHLHVRNFGVSDRSVAADKGENATTIALGSLEPEDRVEISFVLIYRQGEVAHPLEEVLLGVEPAQGEAKRGAPGMTLVGRAWFSLFRFLSF